MNTIDPVAPETSEMEVVDEEVRFDTPEEVETPRPVGREESPHGGAEPTEADFDVDDITALEAVPLPIKPIPITRTVSGRYTNCPRPWKLELRVDVDGHRPMKRVSGDYFYVSGSTTSYFGSFVVNAPAISVTTSAVTITGIASMTWTTSYNKLQVVIPRHSIFLPPANAHAQWMTVTNIKGAAYTCVHDSPYLRTVDLEQDHEKGVTPFGSYNTGSLPSGGPARILSVARAYGEAGIEMRDSGIANEVPTAPGSTWSNAELHAAMVNHFSLWKDEPQWKVWLFHALRHDYGPGLLGIMFDQMGKQRQGCAVFYQSIGGNTAVKLRDQLYTCVHELGHCFNLYHSFHKKFMNPPVPNRPAAKSWMNYPQLYPGGSAAFWAAFPFQFDNQEVIHLRHAYRNNIIIGGNPFGTGAAMEDAGALADNVVDNSGLRLELRTHKSFALGEPVVVEFKLATTDLRGKRVHAAEQLHPNFGAVQIAIQSPSGEVSVYHPPLDHCAQVETTVLDESNRAVYESAYIGYDNEKGHYFDQPGTYKVRGIYYALDGSVVLSDVVQIRVRSPIDQNEEEIAELLLGDEQGMQLYLLGSDSPQLQGGADALELLADKHAAHPLAVYAHLVKGYNASREFKTISRDYQVSVRQPNISEAKKSLTAVMEASTGETGVDNITLNATMRRLARTELIAGNKREAQATLTKMVNIFKKKSLKPPVIAHIEHQAEAVLKNS
jgi:hypothetical protein